MISIARYSRNTWIAACLFSGIFLLSCKDKKDRWYPIADDCAMVAKVNLASLSKKIVMDKIGDFSLDDLFDFSPEDTSAKKTELSTILDDPSSVGIDMLDDLYIFKNHTVIGFVVSLSDESDFSDHLKGTLKKEIITYQEYNYAKIDSFFISWNKDHCIFIIKEDLSSPTRADLENILKIKKEGSVFHQSDFLQGQGESADVFLWFSVPKLLEDQPVSAQLTEGILNKNYSSAYVNFDDGKIAIKAKDFLSPATSQLLATPKSSELNPNLSYIESNNSIALAAIHLNMIKGLDFIQSYANQKHFEKAGLTIKDLEGTFTGEMLINFSDLIELKKIYTGYSFDEDFNKVEVSDTIKVLDPMYTIFVGVLDSNRSAKILDGLYSKNLITKNGSTYTFTLSDFPINFYNTEKGIIISNQKSSTEKAAGFESEFAKELSSHPFIVQGNPSRFFPLIKEKHKATIPLDQVQKATVKISKGEDNSCVLDSEIFLNNPDKNSLLTLIDFFKTKHKSSL